MNKWVEFNASRHSIGHFRGHFLWVTLWTRSANNSLELEVNASCVAQYFVNVIEFVVFLGLIEFLTNWQNIQGARKKVSHCRFIDTSVSEIIFIFVKLNFQSKSLMLHLVDYRYLYSMHDLILTSVVVRERRKAVMWVLQRTRCQCFFHVFGNSFILLFPFFFRFSTTIISYRHLP